MRLFQLCCRALSWTFWSGRLLCFSPSSSLCHNRIAIYSVCLVLANWTQKYWNISLELEMHFFVQLSPITILFFPFFPNFPKHFEARCWTPGSMDRCFLNRADPVGCSREGLNQNTSCYICWQLGDTLHSACFPWGVGRFLNFLIHKLPVEAPSTTAALPSIGVLTGWG